MLGGTWEDQDKFYTVMVLLNKCHLTVSVVFCVSVYNLFLFLGHDHSSEIK